MSHNRDEQMQRCVDECQSCEAICLEMVTHCLEKGGEHAVARHVTALLDCAEICGTGANFMSRGSALHRQICEVCAEACDRCAQSCEAMGDDDAMRRCAEECRRCAESCRQMTGSSLRA